MRRIASAYELCVDDLLVHDLGSSSMTDEQLDLDPPDELLALLSAHTGVAVERIRSMSIMGWMPKLIDSVRPPSQLFTTYVKQFSVLLSPDRRDDKLLKDWRPWIAEPRFASPMGCPHCLVLDDAPFLRLHWRLPITASCPEHGIFLEPISRIGMWKPTLDAFELRSAPNTLRELDAITLHALTSGSATLPTVCMPAGTWLRLLRTILDELNTIAATARNEHRVLKAVWQATGLPMRVSASVSRPFEAMTCTQQVRFLQAAATSVSLVSNQDLAAFGPDVSLLGGVMVSEVDDAQRHAERWRQVGEAIDALMKCARETPEGARQVRAVMLFGKPTSEQIAEVDRMLAAEGINVPASVT